MNRNPRVAIVTAVASEMAAIHELLELEDFTDPDDGSVYMRGVFSNENPKLNCALKWDVVLPMPSSAGNVFSAITTERIAKSIKPDVIMLVGCAGGIPGKTKLFDVVVADKVFYYEPGKADKDLIPRPDLVRPTKKMIERAKAEQFFDRWYRYLKQHLPNEKPAIRIEPIAAGELLIKNSEDSFMTHIKLVAPRSIAVEQEGFGLLMAAHEHHVQAIVIRGISDLLDDKGSDAEEDLAAFNPKQVKAARHATAFALSMLANLDVTWIPEVEFEGMGRVVTLQVTLEGDSDGVEDVKIQLLDWLRDGKLTGLKFAKGSIKAEFDIESGHALILRAAYDAGIVTEIGGYRILNFLPSEIDAPQIAYEIAATVRSIDLDASPSQAALEKLRESMSGESQYQHLVSNVVGAAAGTISRRFKAKSERREVTSSARNLIPSRREMLESLFKDVKRKENEMMLDIRIDLEEMLRFSDYRFFFVWPNLGAFLRSVGMLRKQFDIDSIVRRGWEGGPRFSKSYYFGKSAVENAVKGKAMSYDRCRAIVEGMNEICNEMEVFPRACVLASIFSIENIEQLRSLSTDKLHRLSLESRIDFAIYESMASGALVTYNVARAVASSLFSDEDPKRIEIEIPFSNRSSKISAAVESLSAQNLLSPARDEVFYGHQFRSF